MIHVDIWPLWQVVAVARAFAVDTSEVRLAGLIRLVRREIMNLEALGSARPALADRRSANHKISGELSISLSSSTEIRIFLI